MARSGLRIGILGGTFNPVHVGHLLAARHALEALKLDKVLLIPCAIPALKPQGGLLPAAQRLKLLKIAVKGSPGLEVDGMEVRRGGVSYTIETLRRLKTRHPKDHLYFFMGSDALKGLPRWKEARELKRYARLVVMSRPGTSGWLEGSRALGLLSGHGAVVLRVPAWDISSSLIRQRLKQGLSIRWMVPEGVEKALDS